MSTTAIGDHALISDCHSTGLIDRAGSVAWLCWPRVDRPSLFGRLLDPRAGHWSIAPLGATVVDRRYVDRTLVLETTFTTDSGTVILTDALATGPGERGHRLGRRSPRLLVRRVMCVTGRAAERCRPAARRGRTLPGRHKAIPGGPRRRRGRPLD